MTKDRESSFTRTNYLATGCALLAVAVSVAAMFRRAAPSTAASPRLSAVHVDATLDRTLRDHVLRVGVGGFPPYSIIDTTKADPKDRFSGYAIDLAKEIAARHEPPLRVEVSQVNF